MKHLIIILLFFLRPAVGIELFETKSPDLSSCVLNDLCKSFLAYPDHIILLCTNFVSLSQFNLTNCQLNHSIRVHAYLQFYFEDNTFLSSGLSIMADMVHLIRTSIDFNLYLTNLAGIDMSFFLDLIKPTDSNHHTLFDPRSPIELMISNSQLRLFYNDQNLMDPENCNTQNFEFLIDNDGENILGHFIGFGLSRITPVNNKMCKYLFQNLTISVIQLSEVSIQFYGDTNSTSQSNLNAAIKTLDLSVQYKLILNVDSLHPEIFNQIESLMILDSSLLYIQTHLFKDRFLQLRSFYLEIINIRDILHGPCGIEWVKVMNWNVEPIDLSLTKSPSNLNYIQDAINRYSLIITFYVYQNAELLPVNLFPFLEYQFPDEDFCLFNDFPMYRLVFAQVHGMAYLSCTTAWLLQYEYLYPSNAILYTLEPDLFRTYCNLTDLMNKCSIVSTDSNYFLFDDLSHSLNKVKQIMISYIGSSVSAFGLITNLLILLTILYNQKRRKEIRAQPKNKSKEIVMLDQSLYKYILFNSTINSVYLLMYLLDYSIDCTPIRLTSDGFLRNCFFNNMIMDVIGSFLKLLSNFSLIQISLNRFLLVGKDQPDWLIHIAQVSMKKFFIITAISSSLLSSIVYFQKAFFVIKTFNNDLVNYYYGNSDYHFYFWGHTDKQDNYNSMVEKLNELPLLTAFTVIHDLFGYFLFCLFSVILDVLTVKRLHDALLEKNKLKGNVERKKNRESERKSIMMVVLSSSANIIFRAPELVSLVFYYIITHDGGYVFKMLCWTYGSCLVFVDIANVFYIMSLCFQFFFYIKFNSNFKCSFGVHVRLLVGKIPKFWNFL